MHEPVFETLEDHEQRDNDDECTIAYQRWGVLTHRSISCASYKFASHAQLSGAKTDVPLCAAYWRPNDTRACQVHIGCASLEAHIFVRSQLLEFLAPLSAATHPPITIHICTGPPADNCQPSEQISVSFLTLLSLPNGLAWSSVLSAELSKGLSVSQGRSTEQDMDPRQRVPARSPFPGC